MGCLCNKKVQNPLLDQSDISDGYSNSKINVRDYFTL